MGLSMVACSGGGSRGAFTPISSTPSPTATVKAAAPTPFPTLTPTPLVSGTTGPLATATPKPGTSGPGTPTPQPIGVLVPFESPSLGFAISYPGNWEVEQGDVTQGDLPLLAQDPVGFPRMFVNLLYPNELATVEAQAKGVLDQFKRSFPTAKVLSEAPFPLTDGTSGYAYTLEFTTEGETLRARIVVVAHGSRVFQIVSSAMKTDFDNSGAQLDQIAKSFKARVPAISGVSHANALTIAMTGPSSLDPHLIGDANSYSYVVQIFGGLVGLDRNLSVVPDLAQGWEVADAGKTYTFTLRPGLKFQSGKPLTAADVKYSIERATAPATGSSTAALYLNDIVGVTDKLAGTINEVSGVKVLDAQHIQIKIKDPVPYFLSKLTHPVAFVVQKDNVESDRFWFVKPDGSGPFKLRAWDLGLAVVLERNSGYHRTVPSVPLVLIWNLASNALAMYQAGEVDVTPLGAADLAAAKKTGGALASQLQETSDLTVNFLGFNSRVAPFDDPRARRAFLLASDVSTIIKNDFNDNVTRAAGILPLGMPGYNAQLKPAFDAAEAKTLWDQVVADKGATVSTVKVQVFGNAVPPTVLRLADMWQKTLGVKVLFASASSSDLGVSMGQNKANLYDFGWVADYPDPQNFLDLLFHSKSVNNYGLYKNAEFDRVIELARVEQNGQKRLQLYQQAESLLIQDGGAIPLYFARSYNMVSPNLKGWFYSPQQVPDLAGVSITRPLAPVPGLGTTA